MVCICRDFWTFLVDPKDPKMTQKWLQKQTNANTFQFVIVFMLFLSKFQKISWLRMLEMFKKEHVSYPRGFFEEINALFQCKNASDWDQIWIKFKKFGFKKIISNFCLFFERPRGLTMLKTFNKENFRCPVAFFEEMKATYFEKNASNWNRNRQKPQKIQILKVFMQLLSSFWKTR